MGQRLLVVDESLTTRLGRELRARGRQATTVAQLQLKGSKDPELLPALATVLAAQGVDVDSWTLVTADDAMPDEHGALLGRLGLAVATLRPWDEVDTELDQEAYKREVVHRWAHRMATHDNGEVRRYWMTSHRRWTSRRGS